MNSIDLRCLEKMFVDTRFSQQRARQSNLTKLTRNHKILGGAKRLQQFNGARKNGCDRAKTCDAQTIVRRNFESIPDVRRSCRAGILGPEC